MNLLKTEIMPHVYRNKIQHITCRNCDEFVQKKSVILTQQENRERHRNQPVSDKKTICVLTNRF